MTSGRDGQGDAADPRSPDDPWLPIGAAARLVGVGPDTLRRWADGGKVQSYQTAGGHRRFLRSSLEAMTSAPRRTRYGTGQLTDASTTIIGDAHRRMQRTGYAGMPWQSRLSPEQREDFRRWGQRTFNLVIEYVAANKRSERELLLDEAEKMGALYGREALAAGLTLAEAIEAFLFYRSPVLESILAHLRRRVAEVAQVTAAVREANAAIDQVLTALVNSYGRRRRSGS